MILHCKDGVVKLPEKLDFHNVEALLPEGCRLMADHGAQVFDLSGVVQADSAGLALLIAWWRFAKKHAAVIHFKHLPETLIALMKVTNVDTVLAECLS